MASTVAGTTRLPTSKDKETTVMIKTGAKLKAMSATAALLLGLGLGACRVEKTEEGEMPKVDVDVKAEEGALPKYDVDAPDVDVKTETREVEVPTGVDVTYPEGEKPPADQKPPAN
jgi:hypothetical protein